MVNTFLLNIKSKLNIAINYFYQLRSALIVTLNKHRITS